MVGKVEQYLKEKKKDEGALFFAVIDPLDYDTLDDAESAARAAYEAGADMIVVGGSTGVQGQALDVTVSKIKKAIDVPVNLFPGNIATVTAKADSIYFMSMLNSRNPYWITQAQMLAAPVIKKIGIEPLPVAYMVVGDGGTVAWVGDSNPIPLNKPKIAAAMALAAEYMGFRFIFTDAGSNPPNPVSPEMVGAVKSVISPETFYIVAGGIRTEAQVRADIKAGADAVQIGTAIEEAKSVQDKVAKLVKAVKEEGKKRI
jgi:phosphoglycerol geranylgeranyltransferase